MIFQGQAIQVELLDGGIAELIFDSKLDSVNKFDRPTLHELWDVTQLLKANADIKGVLVSSGKAAFVVGADITEFVEAFTWPDEKIIDWGAQANEIFDAFEDLDVPKVAAINGAAMGGGLEITLAAEYRVMADTAVVALPEVKLGIIPGFGGTVRLPRLIGTDTAIEWITTGSTKKPAKALDAGAVDMVVSLDELRDSALGLLNRCIDGELDWRAKRQPKLEPLPLPPMEQIMSFEMAKGMVAQKAGPHYPAPLLAVKTIEKSASLGRAEAIKNEGKAFLKASKTDTAKNLVNLFLRDQGLKKLAKDTIKEAAPVNKAGVLGAGIMGGGIAYQSAVKGTPILMKDINEAGIQLGLDEAAKLLSKSVERGKMKPRAMADVLNNIRPTLSYGDFGDVDVVVEAVVENEKVKKLVLAEAEGQIHEDAVLASNTSTISIDAMASALKRPEQFCGMHFFNPVHRMPLVEVIRGEKSSDKTIATVVDYALKMGKTPIVVNNCPGFLVNRILFPYFGAFDMLLRDGADFRQVDKVMEKFGMPMGPAYLSDVVGIDTCVHADGVMAAGFPERMAHGYKATGQILLEQERLGQKNGKGYYEYEPDRKGKPKKIFNESILELLAEHRQSEIKEFSEEEIIERLMVAMCLESVRCLEDNIVATPMELDMALIYGIGFPPFRGGAISYIDSIGTAEFCRIADKYADLSPLYKVTDKLREMAATGASYFG